MPDYQKIIQRTVNHIENNLYNKIEMEDIAEFAGFSLYHFMRIFSTFTGYTLKEYVRERRLSEAATELIKSNEQISKLAGKYGFETSESFIRAFKKLFDLTPSKYRKQNQLIKFTPKLKVQVCTKENGGKKVDYKIKNMPELYLIGVMGKVYHGDNSIIELWRKFKLIVSNYNELKNLPKIGLCFHDPRFVDVAPEANDRFKYFVGVLSDKDTKIPEDLTSCKIKEAKYAIFSHKGSLDTICKTYRYISCDWIQTVDYQWALGDELEWYGQNYGPEEYDNTSLDIYVPII